MIQPALNLNKCHWSNDDQKQYHRAKGSIKKTMTRRTETQQILILDDQPADAVLLQHLLAAETRASVVLHRSSQGIFPTDLQSFGLIFLAESYAATSVEQMVSVLRQAGAVAAIVFLGDETHNSPQQFAGALVAAAHSGLDSVQAKHDLSPASVRQILDKAWADPALGHPQQAVPQHQQAAPRHQAVLDRSANQRSTAHQAGTASHSGHRPRQAQAAEQPSSAQHSAPPQVFPAEDLGLDTPKNDQDDSSADWLSLLSTAAVRLRNQQGQWHIEGFNDAASLLEQLNAGNRHLPVDEQLSYNNLDLSATLDALSTGSVTHFEHVLRLSDDPVAQWRTLHIRKTAFDTALLEIHEQSPISMADSGSDVWREIVASTAELSALVDEEGILVEMLSGDWQKLSSDPQTLRGQTLTSLLPETERHSCREALSRALNTGKEQRLSMSIDLSDGPLALQACFSVLRADVGGQRLALWSAADVTERQEREQQLRARDRAMSEFVRRVPFALAMKDADGRFEWGNSSFADRFGLRPEQIAGKTENDLFGPELAAQLINLERQMQDSGDTVEAHIQIDADDWMSYRFVKLPLHGDSNDSLASCLLVLPGGEERELSTPSAELEAPGTNTERRTKKKAR